MNASLDITGAEQEALDWLYATSELPESSDDEAGALNILQGAGAGALTGAATGAALGPYGALAGGLIGGAAGAISTATAPQPRPQGQAAPSRPAPRVAPTPRPVPQAARPPSQPAPPPRAAPTPIRPSAPAPTPGQSAAPCNCERAVRQLERLLPLLLAFLQRSGASDQGPRQEPDLSDLLTGRQGESLDDESPDEPGYVQESLAEYAGEDFGSDESSDASTDFVLNALEGLPEDDSEAIAPACAIQEQAASFA
ncbi:MAG TPA: hypothetical protein VH477_00300 [Bryobacteraceae bacterium]